MAEATLKLTLRDQDLLRVLCRCVRMLDLLQIIRGWWQALPEAERAVLDRLTRLERVGLIEKRQALVRQIGPLDSPVVVWQPNMKLPDLGSVAWRLAKRWTVEPSTTTIFFASARCARIFGGRRRGYIPRAFQVSHDLGVSEMFLAVRRFRPELVPHWVDEDRLAPYRRREKLPDAVLAVRPDAIPGLVLEFGAGYSKQRLLAFHDDNQSRGLSYEIW